MHKFTTLLFLSILLGYTASCVQTSPEAQYKEVLTQRLSQMEKQFDEYKKKLAASPSDMGLAQQIRSQQALLKSRMERTRAKLANEEFH